MPLYDYLCLGCSKEFEEQNKIEERLSTTCPGCGSKEVKLLISTTSRDWFRPHLNEHLSADGPIFVESKEHYRNLCKKNGVYARCL